MGCDIDSYAASAELGFSRANTSNFKKDQFGYDKAWSEIDRGVASYRMKNSYDRNVMSEDFWEGQKNAEEDLIERSWAKLPEHCAPMETVRPRITFLSGHKTILK